MSSSNAKVLAALALLITFVAGIVVGLVGDRAIMMRRPPIARYPPARFIVRHLDRRLHLNDQQRTEITAIVQRHEQRIIAIWSGVRPQVRNEIEAANSEINRVLTPEQRAQFAKMKMRLRR